MTETRDEKSPAPVVPIPVDGAAFLAELAPLPFQVNKPVEGRVETALRLSYHLVGPAGSSGELVVVLASAGLRTEAWHLTLPAVDGGQGRDIRALRVQNRNWVWAAVGDSAGEKYPNPLNSVAEAYDARGEEARRRLVDTVRHWQSELDKARSQHPGEREEIEGISCLRMNMAGQVLCLWEETGLPLRHQGDAFSLELRGVDKAFVVDAETFALPAQAASAIEVAAPLDWDLKGEDWLAQLERGNPAALASYLTPGLRLPTAAELGI